MSSLGMLVCDSWIFDEQHKDPLFGKKNLKEVYLLGNPEHNGRYTVPLFWSVLTRKSCE